MKHNKKISAFNEDVLADHDATSLKQMIVSGDVSALEVVDASIIRSKKVHTQLNAVFSDSYETALEKAKQLTRQPSNGAFSGVPSFIKDTDDVKGLPTTFGSAATAKTLAKKNSQFVDQYESLGFINLGKSSLPELGLTGTTEPVAFGAAHNPWHKDYSTGGSSGGSAALVAAGVVTIAHANDGAGSIRIPASCCGLVGLKPTRSRLVNVDGSGIMPVNTLSQGVVTRTVRDTVAFYSAAENYYKNPKLPAIGDITNGIRRRLKIALVTSSSGASVHKDCMDSAQKAAKLCESLGHQVEVIQFPFSEDVLRHFYNYWGLMAFTLKNFGSSLVGKGFDKSKLEPLSHAFSDRFYRAKFTLPSMIYNLKKFSQQYSKFFEEYDVLLSPTLATPPPKLGHLSTEIEGETAIQRLLDFIPFTPFQNISGAPAISLPMGVSQQGLPIGIQFSAAYGQDKLLLELALELEQAMPWVHLNNVTDKHMNSVNSSAI